MIIKYSNLNTAKKISCNSRCFSLLVCWLENVGQGKEVCRPQSPPPCACRSPCTMDGGFPPFPPNFVIPISAWTPHLSPGQLSLWSIEQVACFHKHKGTVLQLRKQTPQKTSMKMRLVSFSPLHNPNNIQTLLCFVSFSLVWSASFTYQL